MKGSAADKICDAMLELLQEKTLDRISVKELTALAGVNRSTYSYHFYDKEDVVEAIISRFNMGMGNIFFKSFARGGDVHSEFREARKAVLQYFYDNRSDVAVLWGAGYGMQFMTSFTLALEEFYHQLEFGTEKEGEPVTLSDGALYDLKIKQAVYEFLADVEYWHGYGYSIPIDDVIDRSTQAADMVIHSVRFKSRMRKERNRE